MLRASWTALNNQLSKQLRVNSSASSAARSRVPIRSASVARPLGACARLVCRDNIREAMTRVVADNPIATRRQDVWTIMAKWLRAKHHWPSMASAYARLAHMFRPHATTRTAAILQRRMVVLPFSRLLVGPRRVLCTRGR